MSIRHSLVMYRLLYAILKNFHLLLFYQKYRLIAGSLRVKPLRQEAGGLQVVIKNTETIVVLRFFPVFWKNDGKLAQWPKKEPR